MNTLSKPARDHALFVKRIPTATAICLLSFAPFAQAASDSWTGGTDGNWSDDSNWVTAAPGSTSVTNNADTATFNTDPGNKVITIDANRNIGNITFDTPGAGSYTIGSAGANGGNALKLSSGGKILMTSTVADGVVQTFNAPLTLHGNYNIDNQTVGTARYNFAGSITAASNSTLYLYTSDTASSVINTISGNMSNGAGTLSVSLGQWSSGLGRGRVELTGNNTYTGKTIVNVRGGGLGIGGELIISGTNNSAGETEVARGTLTLNNAANGGLASGLVTMGAGSYIRANIAAAGTLSNNFVQNNSAYFAGDHAITINGTFTNTTIANRPLTNSLASGQKLTLNGDVFLSNLSGTGRVWQLRGSGETIINGDVMDFSGGKGTAASGLDFSTTGTGARSLTLAGDNTYSGNTVLSGGASTLFVLAETGSMTFYIGDNGVNNQITGSATAIFDGSFSFNLDDAVLADGNSWTIVDVATVIESFAGTFAVSGFSESGNVWTNGSGLSFDESTGILSYTAAAIPEPSAAALLAAAAGLLVAGGRRRRHNA